MVFFSFIYNDSFMETKKYKLNSDVQIKDISNKYVVGVISNEKFEEIKKEENKSTKTIRPR